MSGKLAALIALLQQPAVVYVATTLAAFVGFISSVFLLWKAKLDIDKLGSELRRRNIVDEQLSLQIEKLRLDIALQKEENEQKEQIVKIADMVEMRSVISSAWMDKTKYSSGPADEIQWYQRPNWEARSGLRRRSRAPRYLRYLAAFFAVVFAIGVIAAYQIL